MIIRASTNADVPQIVALLKRSLGESLMPKSESFWRWKHEQNPFGKSPVLLAFEDDELIGVRAFMRWEWQDADRVYRAVRAVDTATHPDHQGKGIFKKLTLQLVEQCKTEGVEFVFNTPNKASMPGYLKMGWQAMGRLPLQMKFHFYRSRKEQGDVSTSWDELENHPLLTDLAELRSSRLGTAISQAYLKWRYETNPNVKYNIISANNKNPFILIYRVKKFKKMNEVRITELLARDSAARNIAFSELGKIISGFKVVSISKTQFDDSRMGFIPVPLGPVVTTRNLNMQDWPECLNFANWSPSLGDLELF